VRCIGCNTQLDPDAVPDDARHAWHTYWDPERHLCRQCFKETALRYQEDGNWPTVAE